MTLDELIDLRNGMEKLVGSGELHAPAKVEELHAILAATMALNGLILQKVVGR